MQAWGAKVNKELKKRIINTMCTLGDDNSAESGVYMLSNFFLINVASLVGQD